MGKAKTPITIYPTNRVPVELIHVAKKVNSGIPLSPRESNDFERYVRRYGRNVIVSVPATPENSCIEN